MNILEVKNLNMSYKTIDGEVEAVKDVSFTVKEGESFGIVGESGCGKTSVAMSLLQLQADNGKITNGEIIFDGKNIVGLNESELTNFYGALILLGIGWNFSFIGSTSLLANNHTQYERGKAQGMNDMFVFGFVALASLASGSMINCSGESIQEGWKFVSLSMFPLLALATGTILLLKQHPVKSNRNKII